MNLNDLLKVQDIDPQHVVLLRHRPVEPELRKVLPWLAIARPEVFNAYQQTQVEALEKVMATLSGRGHVASFIGHEPGKALFIGLYAIGKSKPLTVDQYWKIPAYIEMKKFGMRGLGEASGRDSVLWFDLRLTDFYSGWKGKMVVGWPPPERSWWRRAHRNDVPVLTIHEESILEAAMPSWDEITFSWEDLKVLPPRWRAALAQWRGIYYIFDTSDAKGYVGSAYGEANIHGRWMNYAARGHGGNKLLKDRDPRNFRFSVLQRVSPDMNADELIRLEGSWKVRLSTRQPYGLNEN